jgi:hypothetical protein
MSASGLNATGTGATIGTGQSVKLSSLFSYSDTSPGASVVAFDLKVRTPGAGTLTFNGGPPPNGELQPDGTILYDQVPLGELDQWSFVAGSAAGLATIASQPIDNVGNYGTAAVANVTVTASGGLGTGTPKQGVDAADAAFKSLLSNDTGQA